MPFCTTTPMQARAPPLSPPLRAPCALHSLSLVVMRSMASRWHCGRLQPTATSESWLNRSGANAMRTRAVAAAPPRPAHACGAHAQAGRRARRGRPGTARAVGCAPRRGSRRRTARTPLGGQAVTSSWAAPPVSRCPPTPTKAGRRGRCAALQWPPPPCARAVARDYAVCRWLTSAAGVGSIPPSAFCSPSSALRGSLGNWARFAFCKRDETIAEVGAARPVRCRAACAQRGRRARRAWRGCSVCRDEMCYLHGRGA